MGVSIQRHTQDAWSPEECHGVPWEEVWVGFQASLKSMEKKKSFATQRDSNSGL